MQLFFTPFANIFHQVLEEPSRGTRVKLFFLSAGRSSRENPLQQLEVSSVTCLVPGGTLGAFSIGKLASMLHPENFVTKFGVTCPSVTVTIFTYNHLNRRL